MQWANELSIVVPVAQGDDSWRDLLVELVPLRDFSEILFLVVDSISLPLDWQRKDNIRVIPGSAGRAKQLNLGAKEATRPVLWFLHSDSRFTFQTLLALEGAILRRSEGISYFDLGFFGGPGLMWINSVGVWFRSRFLKLPFGDQGFLMTRSTFASLGGFDPNTPFGEDHLMVWKAHELGIPLRPIRGKLLTSARKYLDGGWWPTTRKHLFLTFQQGKTEWFRIREGK